MNEVATRYTGSDLKSKKTAIKAKCWDCCGWESAPRDCGVEDCPLYTHRPMGNKPLTIEAKNKIKENPNRALPPCRKADLSG